MYWLFYFWKPFANSLYGKYLTVFLYCFVSVVAIKYFIRIYKDVKLEKRNKGQENKFQKGTRKSIKKLKREIECGGKIIHEKINSLEKRIQVIEDLCEETPEEEQERLSMSQRSINISNTLSSSQVIKEGITTQTQTQKSMNRESMNKESMNKESMNKEHVNRESINHSLSNMDMSESVMLEL